MAKKTQRIDTGNQELMARFTQAVRARVQAVLEKSPASDSSFPDDLRVKRALSYAQFRRKFKDRRLLRRIEAMLCGATFESLVSREIRRRQRVATDPAQLAFAFPGFEHVPRSIRIEGNKTQPIARVTVGQFLPFADRFQKRSQRNTLAGAELLRMATLLRDQPPEMTVAEALKRLRAA